jgi:hypothetical protein
MTYIAMAYIAVIAVSSEEMTKDAGYESVSKANDKAGEVQQFNAHRC